MRCGCFDHRKIDNCPTHINIFSLSSSYPRFPCQQQAIDYNRNGRSAHDSTLITIIIFPQPPGPIFPLFSTFSFLVDLPSIHISNTPQPSRPTMSSPSIDLPSIQTNFAPYLSSTSSSSKSNSNRSSPPHHPHHPHHPQRMPSTPTLASPALSFQSRSFSLTSRFSSSSLHSQYSACSTSGRSPSASPGPATPCDVLSRSPSFSQDRPISLPHPHHHQQHHAGAAGPHKGSMHGTHGGHHDQAHL